MPNVCGTNPLCLWRLHGHDHVPAGAVPQSQLDLGYPVHRLQLPAGLAAEKIRHEDWGGTALDNAKLQM
jgi:hypothetical protein